MEVQLGIRHPNEPLQADLAIFNPARVGVHRKPAARLRNLYRGGFESWVLREGSHGEKYEQDPLHNISLLLSWRVNP